MLVMLTNNTGMRAGWLAGKYPGRIGHLFSPGGQRGPYADIGVSFALDNGAFAAFTSGATWDEAAWIGLLDWAKLRGRPEWAIVPDVVGNAKSTIANWERYAPVAKRYGWPLAFAVQDGMHHCDVPSDAEVVFVGGSTQWKWATVTEWVSRFKRVHVGRVNTFRRLKQCSDIGVESVDGTGWLRGDQRQWRGLNAFLSGASLGQMELWEARGK